MTRLTSIPPSQLALDLAREAQLRFAVLLRQYEGVANGEVTELLPPALCERCGGPGFAVQISRRDVSACLDCVPALQSLEWTHTSAGPPRPLAPIEPAPLPVAASSFEDWLARSARVMAEARESAEARARARGDL